MIDVLILSVALSMDAFAVSIALGASHYSLSTGLKAAIYFAIFQALMPLLGYVAGDNMLGFLAGHTHKIAFVLLFGIGMKMVVDALRNEDIPAPSSVTHRAMLILAIATSIDAMAAGFSLNALQITPYIACAIIGVVTFIFSLIGVGIGGKSGTWLEDKAEMFGGVVLIGFSFKFLVVNA